MNVYIILIPGYGIVRPRSLDTTVRQKYQKSVSSRVVFIDQLKIYYSQCLPIENRGTRNENLSRLATAAVTTG